MIDDTICDARWATSYIDTDRADAHPMQSHVCISSLAHRGRHRCSCGKRAHRDVDPRPLRVELRTNVKRYVRGLD